MFKSIQLLINFRGRVSYCHWGLRIFNTLLLSASACLLNVGSVNAQEFQRYEGGDNLYVGKGGAKKVVDGIEFWNAGTPPRKYKLLGYITDSRHKTGLFGMIRMLSFESAIASAAKENSGDAVIFIDAKAETLGVVGDVVGVSTGTATGYGNITNYSGVTQASTFERPIQRQHSSFALIKYIADETSPSASVLSAAYLSTAKGGTEAVVSTPKSAGDGISSDSSGAIKKLGSGLHLGQEWVDRVNSPFVGKNGVYIHKVNRAIDAEVQVSFVDKSVVSNAKKFALNRLGNQQSMMQDAKAGELVELDLNGRQAFSYEISGQLKNGMRVIYHVTTIDERDRIYLVISYASSGNFDINRGEIVAIPEFFNP